MKSLKESIAVFDPKDLRVAVSIYKCLARNGFEMAALVDHLEKIKASNKTLQRAGVIDQERRAKEAKREWAEIAPRCPDCGAPLAPPNALCGKEKPSNKEG